MVSNLLSFLVDGELCLSLVNNWFWSTSIALIVWTWRTWRNVYSTRMWWQEKISRVQPSLQDDQLQLLRPKQEKQLQLVLAHIHCSRMNESINERHIHMLMKRRSLWIIMWSFTPILQLTNQHSTYFLNKLHIQFLILTQNRQSSFIFFLSFVSPLILLNSLKALRAVLN